MSYSYQWPSRAQQQPPQQQQQGAVGHGSSAEARQQYDRLPVSWPRAVGSHPTNQQGVVQESYPSIVNATGRLGRGMTNPASATSQLQTSAPQPLMGMPLYRPVSPPSSPPHAPSYPMEASFNRVSPPPGFPAQREVPVTLRVNLPAPSPTARPREMVSLLSTQAATHTVYPPRRSSISPKNRCICQRAHCKVLCSICKQASRGRVRLQCPRHPHTIHLMDYDCCPNCKAVNLTEVELRPN